MRLDETPIDGAFVVHTDVRRDPRGYFKRTYDEALFVDHGLATRWVQDNESRSARKGTLRGLHFQRPPHTETKLVRVSSGQVFDVIVDLREHSPSFGRWFGVELSAENHDALYVPRGCAHSFCTLTDDAVVLYKVDNAYAPEAEGGLRYDDPHVGIQWPTDAPFVSEKDSRLPTWEHLDFFFTDEEALK